jgi:hypothetical protein
MIFKSKQINTSEIARESVFDPTSGKYVAEIVGPTFETVDENIIEALKRLGYEEISKSEQEKLIAERIIESPKKMDDAVQMKPEKKKKAKK